MPVYHFNIHDGSNIPDLDGAELTSLSVARIEAVRLAGAVLKDDAKSFWEGSDWHLEVTDDSGHPLFRLMFTAIEAGGDAA